MNLSNIYNEHLYFFCKNIQILIILIIIEQSSIYQN
jgi:hypothetical protein